VRILDIERRLRAGRERLRRAGGDIDAELRRGQAKRLIEHGEVLLGDAVDLDEGDGLARTRDPRVNSGATL